MSWDIRKYINIVLAEESDEDMRQNKAHADALEKTGFWGKAGAGCIIMARDTKRIMLAHRSKHVEQPHTWGGWGGAIDANENPAEAVKREVAEETGYHGSVKVIPLYVFKSDSFRYYNFLAIVDHEFTPELNWENQGYEWCVNGKWPNPLHFGLKALFADPASIRTIKKYVGE